MTKHFCRDSRNLSNTIGVLLVDSSKYESFLQNTRNAVQSFTKAMPLGLSQTSEAHRTTWLHIVQPLAFCINHI
jgi:hypothetical protein